MIGKALKDIIDSDFVEKLKPCSILSQILELYGLLINGEFKTLPKPVPVNFLLFLKGAPIGKDFVLYILDEGSISFNQ